MKWTLKHGYVVVIWHDDDTWTWNAVFDDTGIKYGFKRHYSYTGKSTFTIDEKSGRVHHYYCLPSEVEKLFIIPIEWNKDWKPVNNYEVHVEWVTSKYDGPLGGYCRYKNRLHYFYMCEETEIERHRMFAIYRLTTWQRMMAWYRHLKWYISHGNKFLYAMNWWSWKDLFGIKPKYSWDFAKKYGEPVAYFTDRRS